MTQANLLPQQPDLDARIRERILERAKAINTELLARLSTVRDDLDQGGHRAALGGIDGLERQIDTLRSLLLLLP
jgi:hypothetical protein